jgi:hypothetical protein
MGTGIDGGRPITGEENGSMGKLSKLNVLTHLVGILHESQPIPDCNQPHEECKIC